MELARQVLQTVASYGSKRTRMDQLGAMLNSNLDDFIAGKISTDGGILTALSNDVGFVGLCLWTMVSNMQKVDVEAGGAESN